MQNLLIASVLAVASAEAFYGQLPASGLATWPSTSHGYGSSTVWGAHGYHIGKRSADASYGYGIGYGIATLENRNNRHGHELASGYAISQPHPFGVSYQQRTQLHSGYGKRSAEPFYGYGIGYGIATLENLNNRHGHDTVSQYAISQPHGSGSVSYQQRTQLHSGYGKRSAEPFYGAAVTVENNNNLYGHQRGSGYSISQPHPGHSGSHQQVSRIHGYGYGHGFYGKRSADAYYGAATSAYAVEQAHPGFSYQQVSRLHSGIGYGYGAGYLY